MAADAQTLEEVMIACGVPDDNFIFNGHTKPERIALELFNDDFRTCMDLTHKNIDEECKTLSALTVNQGQIRLTPATKRNLKAFIQWTRDIIIMGGDPATTIFPVNDATLYLRRYKLQEQYIEKSKTIGENAKPDKLSETTKWIDWRPSFINYLRAIPGVDGVPLSYIIRDNDEPLMEIDPAADYLTNYVRMAPLNGESFVTDNREVHTYIMHFIAGNAVAEAKIVAHGHDEDGRRDYLALKEHYEGVGVNALEITKAEHTINNLYYVGEKPPHMWWSEFEKELSRAFAIYQRVENREVHSNSMKLRILMSKIRADFLQTAKAALNIELSRVPMNLTYEDALATFRNAVNLKHPPRGDVINQRVRRVNEVSGGHGRGGQGRFGRGNKGYHRGGARAYGRGQFNSRGSGRGGQGPRKKTRPDSWWAVCDSGRVVECHPRFSYPNHIWFDIPAADKEKITSLRAQSRSNNNNNSNSSTNQSVISEVTHGTTIINGQHYSLVPTANVQVQQMDMQLPPAPTSNTPPNPPEHVTIMGGRNEQGSLRSRNQNSK